MPRQPVPPLAALEDDLKFAPREARLRVIDRAESLCADIRPDVDYPMDWVIHRVTGFRAANAQGVLTGEVLLHGLPVLIERLSAALRMTPDEAPHGVRAEDLLRRWNVSRPTLVRLRKRGLPARRVRPAHAKEYIVFMPRAVSAFESAHRAEIDRAGAFTRLSQQEHRRIVRRATRYRRCLGWSLNTAAKHLAERSGRSHEAIRQVLLRHDMVSPHRAIFATPPMLDHRAHEMLRRAARLGVDLGAMSRRTRRSRASIRRAINLARAARLRTLAQSGALDGHTGPTFALPGAGEVILAPLSVRDGLFSPPILTVGALLDAARRAGTPIPARETQRMVAYLYLRHSALHAIRGLAPAHPQAELLDRIETDLRWAARLKAELLRVELPVLLRTLESRLGRPALTIAPRVLVCVLSESLGALAQGVDAFDPFKGGRLAGPAGLAVDRVAVRWSKDPVFAPASGRATALFTGEEPLPDWTRTLAPWQAWLEPPRRVRDVALRGQHDDRAAKFLIARFGYGGGPPRTLRELLAEFDLAPTRAPIFEQQCVRAAMRA